MANDNSSLPLPDEPPSLIPKDLHTLGGTEEEDDENKNAITIEHEDGSVTVEWDNDDDEDEDEGPHEFDENLALRMSDQELEEVASNLLEGIKLDEDSRKEWVDTRALGISLLGLKLEKPRSDAGASSAPLEGMSTVRHPLLLEATVSFQATARAELLPASGPVKVRNDSPMPPVGIGHNGGPPLNDGLPPQARAALDATMERTDDLAQALEQDLNHYLTAIATEYIPDTDRMLFYVGFGGDGFKKVYNCPLRRRPVSESIDAEDLIISNTATDLGNCPRITHHIKMRQSIMRRMQILGVYRDCDLSPPPPPAKNAVDKKMEDISGQHLVNQRPQDRDFDVYECYCELDLNQFAPDHFKDKGLPLPYRVTLEKDSRKVLDVRRNWKEDDKECLAKPYFVQFPFIRGLGFYGIGYIHLLGNLTNALTAAVREMLDSGMFSNFPGFIYAKGAGRQLTNQFRVPPGGGVGLDIPSQVSLKDAIMPLPYKDPGAGFMQLVDKLAEDGRRLASTANIQVGEGKQDAPVGTTLALIEQASKVLDSAHKRLHAAQAEEFKLLKCRFQEDPEAFWRHNKKPTIQWKKDQFIEALNRCELVPVADPNNPTALHRYAKGQIIKELQKASPDLYDPIGVDTKVLRIADINPEGLFRPTPAPPPPDPRMEAIQQKAQAQQAQAQIQLLETKIKAATQAAAINDKAADRASREKIEQMKIQLEMLKIEEERIIHGLQAQQDAQKAAQDMQLDAAAKAHELALGTAEKHQELRHAAASQQQEMQHAHADKLLDLHHENLSRQHEARGGQVMQDHELAMARAKHYADQERAREKHSQDMKHAQEMHQAKLEAARALAKVKKTAKPKG